MYIAIFKNNGKDYIRLMESYRTKNEEGKAAIRKRIISRLCHLLHKYQHEKN